MIISHFFNAFALRSSSFLVCTVIFAFFATGCDSNSEEMDMDLPIEDGKIRAISLEPGSKRTYNWSLTITARDFEGNVLNEVIETDVIVSEVIANPRSIEGISNPIEIRYYREASPDTFTTNWFTQNDNDLREVAFENPGILPRATLKQGNGVINVHPLHLAMLAGPTQYATVSADPTLRDDPRIVFPYPMDDGDTWVSFSDPFLQTREVVSRDTVRVPAGTFEAFNVRTESDVAAFDGWNDIVSQEGLIERISSSETPLRDANGAPVGTQITEERLTLVQIERP